MTNEPTAWRRIGAYTLGALAVLVGGYQLVKSEDPIEKVPDDVELKSAWACQQCGEVQQLTPRARVELQRKSSDYTVGGKKAKDKTGSEEGRTSFRELILGCPACGKMDLKKAATCPSCKTAFARVLRDKQQECPQCGWGASKKNPRRKPAGRRPRKRG